MLADDTVTRCLHLSSIPRSLLQVKYRTEMSHEIDRNETFCLEDLAVIINDFRSISHAYVKLLKDTDEDE